MPGAHSELLRLYSQITGCESSSERCPGVVRDLLRGIPPRGFFTEAEPGEVQLLLVAKNPGHVIEGETALYAGHGAEEVARAHLTWARRCFFDPGSFSRESRRSLVFHKNILRYVSVFLDVPEREVFRHCAYTNIVKCQTIGEQDSLQRRTIEECFSRHFAEETRVLRPKVILGLGREAFDFLLAHSHQHGRPVLYLKHPSYYYRKDLEPKVLGELRAKIRAVLGN